MSSNGLAAPISAQPVQQAQPLPQQQQQQQSQHQHHFAPFLDGNGVNDAAVVRDEDASDEEYHHQRHHRHHHHLSLHRLMDKLLHRHRTEPSAGSDQSGDGDGGLLHHQHHRHAHDHFDKMTPTSHGMHDHEFDDASSACCNRYGDVYESVVIGRGGGGVVKLARKLQPTALPSSAVSVKSVATSTASAPSSMSTTQMVQGEVHAMKEFRRHTNRSAHSGLLRHFHFHRHHRHHQDEDDTSDGDDDESDRDYEKRAEAEFCIASSLQHAHVVRTIDLVKDNKGTWVEVMEFCPGGDLFNVIEKHGKLAQPEADCLFRQLLSGVTYLHSMGIAHRDLKPENLLLDMAGCLKIADFGTAEVVQSPYERKFHLCQGVCGSLPYIAPECFTERPYDGRKDDVWACGIIYLVFRYAVEPWERATDEDSNYVSFCQTRKTSYPLIEDLQPIELRDLLNEMMEPEPELRLASKQILRTQGFQQLQTCQRDA